MGMIQVHCNDCHMETSFATYLTQKSFDGTAFEKEVCSCSNREFYEWVDELSRSGRLKYDETNEVYYLDGNKILPEASRWELNPVCPECGSKNVYWF